MIVTAWKNGQHCRSKTTYGLKLCIADRDKFINREWKTVQLELEDYSKSVEANVSKLSFWGEKCTEIINKEIGIWFKEKGLIPWPNGKPPKLSMEPISENRFFLQSINK